jgi:hypothetical protein
MEILSGEGHNTVWKSLPHTGPTTNLLHYKQVCVFFYLVKKFTNAEFFFIIGKVEKNYNSRVSLTKIFNLLKLSDLPHFPLTDMPAINTGDWQPVRVTVPAMLHCTFHLVMEWITTEF